MIKKIVAIGPESTGKTELCKSLANHYQTVWCAEYAREYLLKNGKNYTYKDLLSIAKGQIEKEEEAIKKAQQSNNPKNQFVFIDTDMYVMKVWCEFVFNKCHQFILTQIKERKYDLYLLCNIDLPWQPDELREYPDLDTRKQLYNIYKTVLKNQSVPFVEIRGESNQRVEKAIEIIEKKKDK